MTPSATAAKFPSSDMKPVKMMSGLSAFATAAIKAGMGEGEPAAEDAEAGDEVVVTPLP